MSSYLGILKWREGDFGTHTSSPVSITGSRSVSKANEILTRVQQGELSVQAAEEMLQQHFVDEHEQTLKHGSGDSPSLTQGQAIAEIEKLGGSVTVDEKSPDKPVVKVYLGSWALGDDKLTDAGLVHLKDLTKLQTLNLKFTNVTDAGLVHVKGLTQLTYLDLQNTQVTDAGLMHLKGLTNLHYLDLNRMKITFGSSMVHRKGLTLREMLQLFGFGTKLKLTDAGLVHLKDLTKLQTLDLSYTAVTDAGLVHLKGLTQLQSLRLDGTKVTDAGLLHLNGLTNLHLFKTLYLDGTKVTDAGLVHLKGLTYLQTLTLGSTKVTDAGLVHLKGLTSLDYLDLSGTNVTDAGVDQLCQSLPHCNINHCGGFRRFDRFWPVQD